MKLFKYILFSLLLIVSSVGYGQNQVITPAPLGRFALSFDGVDECTNIDQALTVLSSTTHGTWSIWAKPTNIGAGSQDIVAFGDLDGISDFALSFLIDGKLDITLRINGTSQWRLRTDASVASNGVGIYLSIVQNGTAVVLYVDGSAPAQTFTVTTDKTQWFNNGSSYFDTGRIGCINFNNNGDIVFFIGILDEVSLWNTNLSLIEIQEIYNNNKPTNLRTHSRYANLVAWYQMGEFSSYDGTNWNIIDASVNDNPGVTVNMEESDRVISTLIYEQPIGMLRVGRNLITSP